MTKNIKGDAGEKQSSTTGGLKDKAYGRGRYDLLPTGATRRLAKHYEYGVKQRGYPGRNWEKGMPVQWHLDSAKRHLDQYIEGKTDEDHLAASVWHLFAILEYEERVRIGMKEYEQFFTDMGPLWEFNRRALS